MILIREIKGSAGGNLVEKYQQNIFDLMVRKENQLAGLYDVFAGRFKDFEPFWAKRAKEGRSHSSWLMKLQEAEEKNLVSFDEGKIKTYTMETFLKHLTELITEAKAGKVTAKKAFRIAFDLERSLIVANKFKHFESFSEEGTRIIGLLDDELKKHIGILGEMKAKFG